MKKLICIYAALCCLGAATARAGDEAQALPSGATGPVKLTLEQVLDLAVEQSMDVKLAMEKTIDAEGAYKSARADLLPKLNGSVSETRQVRATAAYGLPDSAILTVEEEIPFKISYPGTPSSLVKRFDLPTKGVTTVDEEIDLGLEFEERTDIFNLFTAKLGLNVPLIDLQNLAEAKASKAGQKNASAETEATRESIRYEAAQYYFTILLNTIGVRAYDEKLKLHEQRVALTEDLIRVGTSTPLDLRKEKLALSVVKQQLEETERTLRLAKRELRQLLNLPDNQALDVEGKLHFLPLESEAMEKLIDSALNARPDYQAQLAKERSAELRKKAARNDYYPTVSGIGNYGYQGNTIDDTAEIWFIGAMAQIPIWDSFKRAGKLQQAESKYRQVQNRTIDMRMEIEKDVENLRDEVENGAENITVAEENVQYAEDNLKYLKDREAAGTATSLDVLGAEVDLAEAKYDRIEAIYTHKISCTKWYMALGDVSQVKSQAWYEDKDSGDPGPDANADKADDGMK